MLVIKQIKVSGLNVLRPKKLTRVRLGYDNHVCANKNKGIMVDYQTIQWREDFTLPLVFRRSINFQLFPAHQFGYNPEEINTVCYASLSIDHLRTNKKQANVTNSQGEVVGRMYLSFVVINHHGDPHSTETTARVQISSVLAHFDRYYGDAGYFEFRLQDEATLTPEVSLVAGELLWADRLLLPVYGQSNDDTPMKLLVYVENALVGQAEITLRELKSSEQKFRRIVLCDPKSNSKCGNLFIDIVLLETNMRKKAISNSAMGRNSKGKSQMKLPTLFPVKQDTMTPQNKYQNVKSSKNLEVYNQRQRRNSDKSSKIPSTLKMWSEMDQLFHKKLATQRNPLRNNIKTEVQTRTNRRI